MLPEEKSTFAIWVTGLPASGKSTLAAELKAQLKDCGIDIAILESDELRKVLTPHPRYDEQERELFYRQLVYIGALLTRHGVPVLFDATANLRRYRDLAREQIPRLLEVYVDTPLKICMERDPKGIYHAASVDPTNTIPGLKSPYEPPEHPEIVVHGDGEMPEQAAKRVIAKLAERGLIGTRRMSP